MKLEYYDRKNIQLTDIDGNIYKGTGYFCDKEDYETIEDGIEISVENEIWIFYESDIKNLKIIDN